MNYRRTTAVIALAATLTAMAGTPDARTAIITARAATKADAVPAATTPVEYIPVIIEIPDDDTADLDNLGAVIYYNRNHLYLACIPDDRLAELCRIDKVGTFSVAMSYAESLDVAHTVTGVNRVHAGESIVSPYTGRGVVTGICDIGFDPRHTNFTDRVKQWVIYNEMHAMRTVYDGYADIVANAPETDNVTKTHATHVANILGGGTAESPYHGVATGSDMIVTTGQLTDVGILAGIEDVVRYARRDGRRAVVNISAGSYLGPHDGTDLVGRYLSALADEAVICFSAGNFGQRNNVFGVELDSTTEPVGSLFFNIPGWDGLDVNGMSDLWSDDGRPFETRLVIWDVEKRTAAYIGEWVAGDTEPGICKYTLEDYVAPEAVMGKMWIAWGLDPGNGRYNVTFSYDYTATERQSAGPWARYFVGFHLRSKVEDTHVTAYADGVASFFGSNGAKGMVNGTADGTVSNQASCPEVVAVGAWNTRDNVPDVADGTHPWNVEVGRVAPWSAYWTSGDGRRLPHFCAPGNPVVSALSRPHYNYDGPKDDADRTARVDGEDRWFAAAGTSMASPYAAGVFALWLEADPTLGVDELRNIAIATADRRHVDIDDPRWGAGALDAYAGIIEVERRAGIGGVHNIAVDNAHRPVSWYTLDGRPVEGRPTMPGIYVQRTATTARLVNIR